MNLLSDFSSRLNKCYQKNNNMKNIYLKYPVISKNITIRVKPNKVTFFLSNMKKSILVSYNIWLLYQKFDGTKDINTIYNEISAGWDINKEDLCNFINDALQMNFIELQDSPGFKEICFEGDSINYYPSVVSIELTNKCNIKCIYCYGSYQPHCNDTIEMKKINEIFAYFRSKGTTVIELTGGECLLHPDFNEILKSALDNFISVGILSNGILFNESHIEIIKKNKNKINLQISIDGATEHTNHLVRGVPNTWEKTITSIKRLYSLDVPLKVVYMITKTNKHEIREVCELFKTLGLKKCLSFSPTVSIGRGCSSNCSILLDNGNYDSETIDLFECLLNEYADVLYIRNQVLDNLYFTKEKLKNCGAGYNIAGISANGDVTACHLMEKDGVLGNIYTDDYTCIFTGNKVENFFRNFNKAKEDKKCIGCEYNNGNCAQCIFKIVEVNKKLLAQGKELCPIAKSNKMDIYLNLSS